MTDFLTSSQRLAVETKGQDILVSAGAGSGKTRVLGERFIRLVVSGEALVTEILALTFTEKSAHQMKSRIREGFAQRGLTSARRELESAWISTFHAFAARLLREHPLEAGVDPEFRVLEEEEAKFLREEAFGRALEGRTERGTDAFELLRVYGEAKIKEGVFKVLELSRHEGLTLAEFFNLPHTRCAVGKPGVGEVGEAFKKMGEDNRVAQWREFEKKKSWDWQTVEEFKTWRKSFSQKRGKKGETLWPGLKAITEAFLKEKMDSLAVPWRIKFEALALAFEASYEQAKKEEGVLDFDDLERLAVRLFKKEDPVSKKLRERTRKKFRYLMVDEFQDTNALQLELVHLLSSGGNLFLVGDFKQSIYRFRGAAPGLFLDKEKAFAASGAGLRIPLLENFRSEAPVLDFVNRFFENLWKEDGLPYEALIPVLQAGKNSSVELHKITQAEEEPMALARLREAEQIARRILELSEQGFAFGGIAILFQAMTDVGFYEQALKRYGIPYDSVSSRGFYSQHEIQDMISYLSFLENPYNDIALAAALRSPLFQISDSSLYWLSARAKAPSEEIPLFEGVQQMESIAEISVEEKEKLLFFRTFSEELFRLKDRLPLGQLLDRILEKTSYELTVLTDSQGTRRLANLKKLVSLAREFESFEPLSLAAFLTKLRRFESLEAREAEAQIEAEESGRLVRLLSIHRAKGLEFPVVFVADLGRARNSSDGGVVVGEAGIGYSLKVRNEITLEWESPASWDVLSEEIARKEKEEWKRLFYVALTRAKTKLILSGVKKEKAEPKASYYEQSSWMEWLLSKPELLEGVKIIEMEKSIPWRRKASGKAPVKLSEFFEGSKPSASLRAKAALLLSQLPEKSGTPSRVIDLPVSAFVLFSKSPEKFRQVYEWGGASRNIPAEEPLRERYGAEALEGEDTYSRADFGTLFHRVLERLDYQDPPLSFEGYGIFFDLLGSGAKRRARQMGDRLLQSAFFKSVGRAKQVLRELPFYLNERHGLIHGIMDLVFQNEKGEWILVDFKTSEANPEKAQTLGYGLQMDIYAYALASLGAGIPRKAVLYFLEDGGQIEFAYSADKIEAIRRRIQQMQEEMLAFLNLPAHPEYHPHARCVGGRRDL